MEKELDKLTLRSQRTLDKENIWIENEQKMHPNSLFFGECLDEEIDIVLPQLIDSFKEKEEYKGYLKVLSEKLEFLKKFQKAIETRLDKEQMTSDEYLSLCQSCLKANEKILE